MDEPTPAYLDRAAPAPLGPPAGRRVGPRQVARSGGFAALVAAGAILAVALSVSRPPQPGPGPTVSPPSEPGASAGGGLLVSRGELASLPTSGLAWTALKAAADRPTGTPNLRDQDEDVDLAVLAKALVFARTGASAYRTEVRAALGRVVGTEAGGETLALGRNLPGYLIAADLIDLGGVDPSFETGTFRPWLRRLLGEDLSGDTLVATHERRPNNWGTHAGAARVAIARYLGDATELARAAGVFRGWLGERSVYAGFSYGDLSWQCTSSQPVGVNPTGCTKSGVVIDGVLPDDMRRGGSFRWPPAATGYPWEALQGAILEAALLERAGYPAWSWSNRALLRAARFLYERAGWPAEGDDEWQPWLLNAAYGTSFPTTSPVNGGKNMSWTDWIYGWAAGPAPRALTSSSAGVRLISGRSAGKYSLPVRIFRSSSMTIPTLRVEIRRDSRAYAYVARLTRTAPARTTTLLLGHPYRLRFVREPRLSAPWTYGTSFWLGQFDDGNSAVRYRGSWRRVSSRSYFGGSNRYSRSGGATATFTFRGRGVAWIGSVGPTRGIARVYIDGKYAASVNLRSSRFVPRRVILARTWSAGGRHSMTIKVVSAGGRVVTVDSFAVLR